MWAAARSIAIRRCECQTIKPHRIAALTTLVKQPDAGRELVKYLALPSSVPVIKNNGTQRSGRRGSATFKTERHGP